MIWGLKWEYLIWTSHPKMSTAKSSSHQAGLLIHCKPATRAVTPLIGSAWTRYDPARLPCPGAVVHRALSSWGTNAAWSSAGCSCTWFRSPNGTTWVVPCMCDSTQEVRRDQKMFWVPVIIMPFLLFPLLAFQATPLSSSFGDWI